jgi:hypothetical protein
VTEEYYQEGKKIKITQAHSIKFKRNVTVSYMGKGGRLEDQMRYIFPPNCDMFSKFDPLAAI